MTMKRFTLVRVPVDGFPRQVTIHTDDELAAWQSEIGGGYVEIVARLASQTHPGLMLDAMANEDGKRLALPVNRRVNGNTIVGPIIVTVSDPKTGDTFNAWTPELTREVLAWAAAWPICVKVPPR